MVKFGTEERRSVFESNKERIPGVGTYSLLGNWYYRTDSTCAVFGSETRNAFKVISNVPGPGNYNLTINNATSTYKRKNTETQQSQQQNENQPEIVKIDRPYLFDQDKEVFL